MAIITGFNVELPASTDTTQRNNQQCHNGRYAGTKQQTDRHTVKNRIVQDRKSAGHQRQGSNKDRTHAQFRATYSRFLYLVALGHFQLDEFNYQNRLSDDDATQGDHADHGSCREFCAHHPVPGNDPHHGHRYR